MTALQLYNTDNEKKQLLGIQGELSEVEKLYSVNALRIFKERYLLKDHEGNIVERLDDLFRRVAVASGLMEVLYLPPIYNKDGNVQNRDYDQYAPSILAYALQLENQIKDIDYKDINGNPLCFKLGDFIVNPFHLQSLHSRYVELFREGKISTTFENILYILKDTKNNGYGLLPAIIERIQKYYDLMARNIFLPNTPSLMNAGTKLNQNAACFTLDMQDYMRGISKTWADVADVFKSGGGIGINYSKLRAKGSYVKTTGGKASGPISWLKIVDAITGEVAQGGKRRGASMGILNMDHPDIESFINLKDNNTLHNHNISICTPDSFFYDLLEGKEYNRKIMDKIMKNVWKTGDPGMVFLENMNANNLLRNVMGYPIDVTNPCSEISMYPYESCILASINLTKFITTSPEGVPKFDIHEFADVSRTVTAFLDTIIDATKYPLPEINERTKNCRRVGTGFMGLADVLTILGIPYNSKEGFMFAEYLCAVMTVSSLYESHNLAKEKGAFPLWYSENYPKHLLPVNAILQDNVRSLTMHVDVKLKDYFTPGKLWANVTDYIDMLGREPILRNCSVTTIAPTGTLSMFSDCSSALEPNFSNAFIKKVTIGEFEYVNQYLKKALEKEGIYSEKLVDKIINENGGSVQGIEEIPESIRKVFVTSMDIHPFDHLMMQSVCQKWISNGISKTINVPEDFDEKLIELCYVLAWILGNKGTTVYRDKCKDVQVLNNCSSHKVGIMDASYYTYNTLATSLYNNIPEEYLVKILDACYPWTEKDTKIVQDYEARETRGEVKTYSYTGIVAEHLDTGEVTVGLRCNNCGEMNIIENNAKTCFLCRKCGTKIGSCE